MVSDFDHSVQAYPKLGSLSAMANPLSKEPNNYKELVGWAAQLQQVSRHQISMLLQGRCQRFRSRSVSDQYLTIGI